MQMKIFLKTTKKSVGCSSNLLFLRFSAWLCGLQSARERLASEAFAFVDLSQCLCDTVVRRRSYWYWYLSQSMQSHRRRLLDWRLNIFSIIQASSWCESKKLHISAVVLWTRENQIELTLKIVFLRRIFNLHTICIICGMCVSSISK